MATAATTRAPHGKRAAYAILPRVTNRPLHRRALPRASRSARASGASRAARRDRARARRRRPAARAASRVAARPAHARRARARARRPRTSTRSSAPSAHGGSGWLDPDTFYSDGTLDRGAARRRRHRRPGAARSPPASSTTAPPSCARPATTPRAIAPWASASSTTSPSPPRSLRDARQARRHLRLGRAPRQRHRGHLRRGARRPLHLDARVAAVSGHRPRPTTPARGRGLGSTVNVPLPRGTRPPTPTSPPTARASARPSPQLRARRASSSRPASTPTATIRSAASSSTTTPTTTLTRDCWRCSPRIAVILEGGYDLDALASLVGARGTDAPRETGDATSRLRRALRRLRARPVPHGGRHGRPLAGAEPALRRRAGRQEDPAALRRDDARGEDVHRRGAHRAGARPPEHRQGRSTSATRRGTYFIAMEYIPGRDLLADLPSRRRGRAASCRATSRWPSWRRRRAGCVYAHEKRDPDGTPLHVVHCDISPGNIVRRLGRHGEDRRLRHRARHHPAARGGPLGRRQVQLHGARADPRRGRSTRAPICSRSASSCTSSPSASGCSAGGPSR